MALMGRPRYDGTNNAGDTGTLAASPTTATVVTVPAPARSFLLFVSGYTGMFRMAATPTNTALTISATNMGYYPAGVWVGPFEMMRGSAPGSGGTVGDEFIQMAAIGATPGTYYIAWLR